jgi:hypothetical protein
MEQNIAVAASGSLVFDTVTIQNSVRLDVSLPELKQAKELLCNSPMALSECIRCQKQRDRVGSKESVNAKQSK